MDGVSIPWAIRGQRSGNQMNTMWFASGDGSNAITTAKNLEIQVDHVDLAETCRNDYGIWICYLSNPFNRSSYCKVERASNDILKTNGSNTIKQSTDKPHSLCCATAWHTHTHMQFYSYSMLFIFVTDTVSWAWHPRLQHSCQCLRQPAFMEPGRKAFTGRTSEQSLHDLGDMLR